MHRKEKALELFSNRYNCSQAVFAAFRQTELLDEASSLRLATMFGGGVAGSGGGMCGAVTGALMALSMRYGMSGIEELANKRKTYELGEQFIAEFEKRMGSCRCALILGLCIGDPERLQKARELKLFETVCVDAIATASDILEEMLSAAEYIGLPRCFAPRNDGESVSTLIPEIPQTEKPPVSFAETGSFCIC